MKQVKELSTMTVTVGLSRTPTTLRYRIVDTDNKRTAQDWTDVTPAAEVTFTVPASTNAIYRDERGNRKRIERRVVVVQANADTDDQFNEEAEYVVLNLKGFES